METQLILIRRADGGCSVMRFVIKSPHDRDRNEATAENIDATITKGRLDCISWRRISPAELPGREYRNAWVDTGGSIDHDMAKAREIHRDRIRAKRAPLLAQLDIDYQRADEAGDIADKQRIAAEKQRLRDATEDPRIEAAQTVEELALVRPV